jgi:uncharacterized protein YjbJ (UPF0337 family)
MGTESMKDNTEGTLNKAMGQVKEAAGSLADKRALKGAGLADKAKDPQEEGYCKRAPELVAR